MKTLFFVSMTVVVCVCLLVPLATRPKAKNLGDAPENKVKHRAQSAKCPTCPEVGEQMIYAPLVLTV